MNGKAFARPWLTFLVWSCIPVLVRCCLCLVRYLVSLDSFVKLTARFCNLCSHCSETKVYPRSWVFDSCYSSCVHVHVYVWARLFEWSWWLLSPLTYVNCKAQYHLSAPAFQVSRFCSADLLYSLKARGRFNFGSFGQCDNSREKLINASMFEDSDSDPDGRSGWISK